MRRRDLPSVDELTRGVDDPLAVDAARTVLAGARETIAAGGSPGDLTASLRAELHALRAPRLRRVLNATGVIVHTNLGRAPLATEALERVVEAARGYSNLEYDLADGRRGSRQEHVADALRRLTGAEAALVVNNNAAAVLLALAALAEGREVVVSRGELIEIGDGFRIPDVLARSGARLREVGTTNRTRAVDYERAVGPETAALLRVHQSNFRVVGFTEQPTVAELAAVARRRRCRCCGCSRSRPRRCVRGRRGWRRRWAARSRRRWRAWVAGRCRSRRSRASRARWRRSSPRRCGRVRAGRRWSGSSATGGCCWAAGRSPRPRSPRLRLRGRRRARRAPRRRRRARPRALRPHDGRGRDGDRPLPARDRRGRGSAAADP